MEDGFIGRTAAVTGGAHGLGKVVARMLCERGARIVIGDIDGRGAKRAAEAISSAGGEAHALVLDVTDEASVDEFRRRTLALLDVPDVLVNNAGWYPRQSIAEITGADFDAVLGVNLKGVFLVSRAFHDDMAERGSGRIVNVASNDAYAAKPTMAHYAAAKAGVVSLTKTFAASLAPHGVQVNGVSPGAILTEKAKQAGFLEKRIPEIPLKRAAAPEDIAEVILFLASDGNRYMTGETVIANGGLTMV